MRCCLSPPNTTGRFPGGLKNAIDWGSRPWGQNSDERTQEFLRKYMEELHGFVVRVLTVLPRAT